MKNELNDLLNWVLPYASNAKIEGDRVVVEGSLHLAHMELTSLPQSFGNLKVGGSLYLTGNQLTSLPASFGNLKVGGSLDLSYNKLTSLPESFGNLQVIGDLYLSHNKLTTLPELIGNLKVGRYLHLSNNKLTCFPESFGNLKVGGDFVVGNNPLKIFPEPSKLSFGIFEDYTYLDGILTDIVSTKTIDNKKVVKHSFGYVVSDGENHAHGKDLRQAFLDWHFKTSKRDLEQYKNLDLDEKRKLDDLYSIYRDITGSCSRGVEMWMNAHSTVVGKIEKEGISINELISVTKNQYGNDRLKAFFGV